MVVRRNVSVARRFRASLGSLLIATGLAIMAWPVVVWGYGWYSQKLLEWELQQPPASAVLTTLQRVEEEAKAPAGVPRGLLPSDFVRAGTAVPALRSVTPRKALPSPKIALAKGKALARLRIARIGLDAVVVEGVDRVALRRGPGHLPKTGLPGEARNCAIAAHRDAWFRRLTEVKKGDPIVVETPAVRYRYEVEEKRVVTPDRGDLLNRGKKPALTLITCTGPGYPNSKYRLLVFCRLKETLPTR